jgi:hypothetical protein
MLAAVLSFIVGLIIGICLPVVGMLAIGKIESKNWSANRQSPLVALTDDQQKILHGEKFRRQLLASKGRNENGRPNYTNSLVNTITS